MGDVVSTPTRNPSDTPITADSPSPPSSTSPNASESRHTDLASSSETPKDSNGINMSDSSFTTLESESTETLESIAKSEASDQDPPSVELSAVEGQTPEEVSDQSKNVPENGEEEEEGECGFCLYMKGGGCKDNFIAWEKCIEEAEKNKEDIVEKCFEVTGALKKCMEAHTDYYEPILRAEKAAEEEVVRELEKEKALKDSEQIEVSKDSEQSEVLKNSEQSEILKDLGQSEVLNEQDVGSKGSDQNDTSGDRKDS